MVLVMRRPWWTRGGADEAVEGGAADMLLRWLLVKVEDVVDEAVSSVLLDAVDGGGCLEAVAQENISGYVLATGR